MRPSVHPLPTTPPSLVLPAPDGSSLQAEVVRLRRMVHAMAQMLVECGVVDPAMVEGRLRLASEAFDNGDGEIPSLKKVGFWARLFGRRRPAPSTTIDDTGAVPTAMMASDQTVPVTKLPFEVQSLYDDGGISAVGSAPKQPRPPTLDVPRAGTCNRCWRRALVNSGQVCARCAVLHG